MSQQEPNRCAICTRLIESDEETRFIQSAGNTLSVHGICLLRVRRLACDIDGRQPPIPTLTRALSLNEFLLSRRPQTGPETISCIAYYFQVKNRDTETLTLDGVQRHLEYSAYKISDLQEVAQRAVTLGLLEQRISTGVTHYIITAKGREVVERLPFVSGK